jgi:Protein of unknown function (DUF3796)
MEGIIVKNKLSYLGFIGFLGLLGPFHNFLGIDDSFVYLIGFFPFFAYESITPDELFINHVRKAATRAFFIGLVLSVLAYIFLYSIENIHLLRLLFIGICSISIMTFMISLEIYERREKKGLANETDY